LQQDFCAKMLRLKLMGLISKAAHHVKEVCQIITEATLECLGQAHGAKISIKPRLMRI